MIYSPELWAIIKLESADDTHYRVVGSWHGGYLSGDSWKFSSGIEGCEAKGDHYNLPQTSGSVYKCYYDNYGMSNYTTSVLNGYIRDTSESDKLTITLLTNEEALDYLESL